MLEQPDKKRRGKNQNDPAGFVKAVSVTDYGEIAQNSLYGIDTERIAEEEKYDGFYAVITYFKDDVGEILKINKHR